MLFIFLLFLLDVLVDLELQGSQIDNYFCQIVQEETEKDKGPQISNVDLQMLTCVMW